MPMFSHHFNRRKIKHQSNVRHETIDKLKIIVHHNNKSKQQLFHLIKGLKPAKKTLKKKEINKMSNTINDSKNWSFETKQLHIGQEQADPVTDARAVPIYATSSFVFHNSEHAADRFGLRDAGNIYGRLTNPTQDIFEQRIAALATASGAAAINYTITALAKAGEHIVASKTIYGGTFNLLCHTLPLTNGIETTFVDPDEEGAFEAAIRPNTKAIFIETLGNPNSNIIDIESVAKLLTPMKFLWSSIPLSPHLI